jgi:hypothetical protein
MPSFVCDKNTSTLSTELNAHNGSLMQSTQRITNLISKSLPLVLSVCLVHAGALCKKLSTRLYIG